MDWKRGAPPTAAPNAFWGAELVPVAALFPPPNKPPLWEEEDPAAFPKMLMSPIDTADQR